MYRSKLAILATTALSLGAVQTASAQPVPYSWTGFYFGVNFGFGGSRSGSTNATVAPWDTALNGNFFPFPGGVAGPIEFNQGGFLGGPQFGYLWFFAPGWVAGFETDFQWSGINDSGSGVFAGNFNTGCGATTCIFVNTTDLTARLSWFGTVRGRFGAVVFDNVIFYATGGFAYGRVKLTGANTLYLEQQSSGDTATYVTPINISEILPGWVAGAGFEGGIGASNWTWRVEYIHIDLGSIGGAICSGPPSCIAFSPVNITDDIVRIGINFRLGGPAT